MRKPLDRLPDRFEGKRASSKYAGVAPYTALRDINDLVARGILCPSCFETPRTRDLEAPDLG